MNDSKTALAAADKGLETSLERLFDFLRIPSISTDVAYQEACEKAARWLEVELTALGFAASVRKTPGRPMVVARKSGMCSCFNPLWAGLLGRPKQEDDEEDKSVLSQSPLVGASGPASCARRRAV